MKVALNERRLETQRRSHRYGMTHQATSVSRADCIGFNKEKTQLDFTMADRFEYLESGHSVEILNHVSRIVGQFCF